MLDVEERPTGARPAGPEETATAARGVTVSGLGAGPPSEARPSPRPGGPVSSPWPATFRRRLAGLNLATAALMVVVGIGSAGSLAGADARATVGRWAGFAARLGEISEATVAKRPPLDALMPYGKGMWIWEPDKTEGGNADAIVAKAKAVGLTHLYVRTGSSWDGFNNGPFLDRLLPPAHAAGLLVYGWDFPRLISPQDDVKRALAAVQHQAPGHNRIDGFSADIETRSEGTYISPQTASDYGRALREAVGDNYLLIATVPRPSPQQSYPYAEVVASFNAVAPMVYWLNRQPDTDVVGALRDLAAFGKPVFPVGQAYDGQREGGRPGVPPPEELWRFMRFGQNNGALGVSFWSWQAANQKAWDAIRDAEEFRPGTGALIK